MFPNYYQQKIIKVQLDRFIPNSKILKIALLIYWVVLTFLLLKPSHLEQDAWYIFDGVDKLVHLSVFAFLGFLFMMVFPRTKFIVFIQIMLIYAFATEILQDVMQFGRSLEVLDAVADTAGVCIGYYIYKITAKILN